MIEPQSPHIAFPLAPKNIAAALLFSVFLGPVGVLYSSVWGGIIMIILGFIVICSKFIVPIVLMWLICCIWAVAAANRYNKKLLKMWMQKK